MVDASDQEDCPLKLESFWEVETYPSGKNGDIRISTRLEAETPQPSKNAIFASKQMIIRFIVLILCSQFAFSVLAMKGVLLPQMLSLWDISKTQFGILMSIYGATHTILYLALAWVQDRYPSRVLIPINMIFGGITTFFLGEKLDFNTLCFLFLMLAIWCEGAFWPAILTAVRRSTNDDNQSKIFGLLEGGRGIVELLQNAIALGLYTYFSYSTFGLEIAFKINAVFMIILGLISWFVLPNHILLKSTQEQKLNREVIEGIRLCLTIPQVWLAGSLGFFIYVIYTSLPFFITYLTDLYLVPMFAVSIFGILSTSGGRIGAALPSGFIAKHFFGGAAGAIKIALIFVGFVSALMVIATSINGVWWLVMPLLSLIIVTIFFMRALYFAPFGEMGIPPRFSGSVIAFAAFLIYLPSSFAYLAWGYLLDSIHGDAGYRYLFFILALTASGGAFFAHKLAASTRHGVKTKIRARVDLLDERLSLTGEEQSFDRVTSKRQN